MKAVEFLIIAVILNFLFTAKNSVSLSAGTNSAMEISSSLADTFYLDTLKIDGETEMFEYSGWKVKEGTLAVFTYTILNLTKDTILLDPTSNCGCLAPVYEKENLEPRETMMISYKLLTEGRKGFCNKAMLIKYKNYRDLNGAFKKITGVLEGQIE